jgi:hypothetical protein
VITSVGSLSISENTTVVTTVTSTDADLPTQSLTYSISSGADSALFNINSITGELTFIAAPDYELPKDSGKDNIYNITVQASDGTLSITQDIRATVSPVNDNTPVIASLSNLSIPENTNTVATLTATDADLPAQHLSYSISGGADAARFSIISATGALTFVVAPDFEIPVDSNTDNIYEIIAQVTDGAQTNTQNISIQVTNTDS